MVDVEKAEPLRYPRGTAAKGQQEATESGRYHFLANDVAGNPVWLGVVEVGTAQLNMHGRSEGTTLKDAKGQSPPLRTPPDITGRPPPRPACVVPHPSSNQQPLCKGTKPRPGFPAHGTPASQRHSGLSHCGFAPWPQPRIHEVCRSTAADFHVTSFLRTDHLC